MTVRAYFRITFLALAIFPLTGCLFRTHTSERKLSNAPLKTATQAELIAALNAQADQVRTMNATIDIDPSITDLKKGQTRDITEFPGFILARKPNMLRMIGLLPVVRSTALDMVSDGKTFKLWIPSKNRFIEGRNDVPTPDPKNALEKLRPQYIYDALLFPHIDDNTEIAVMENDFELVAGPKSQKLEQPDYEIDVIRKNDDKGWYLARKIIFSRTDLLPHRQIVYGEDGNQTTDSKYEDYKDYDGVKFPSQIDINLPQQQYDIVLHIVKLEINTNLKDTQFKLEEKPGAEIIHLDRPRTDANTSGNGGN